jgi:two-component system NtrC family sensor kinase
MATSPAAALGTPSRRDEGSRRDAVLCRAATELGSRPFDEAFAELEPLLAAAGVQRAALYVLEGGRFVLVHGDASRRSLAARSKTGRRLLRGVRANGLVPLVDGTETVGALELQGGDDGLAEALAALFALGIGRAARQLELARASEHERAMIEAALAVNRAESVPHALAVLAATARDLLDAEYVFLVSWAGARARGVVSAADGPDAPAVGTELEPGEGFAYQAVERGEPAVDRNLRRTCVAVPLPVRGSESTTFVACMDGRLSHARVERAIATLSTLGTLTGIASRTADERRRRREQARLDAVLDAVPDGLLIATDEGMTLNPAARRLLAIPDGEPSALEELELRHVEGTPVPPEEAYLRLLARCESPTRFRRRALCPDGVERVLDGTVAPIPGSEGEPTGTVVVFRDVTEEYARELLTQGFLERLFETIPLGVAVIDPASHELLSVNQALVEITGYPTAEIVGRVPPYPWWAGTEDELEFEKTLPPEEVWRAQSLFRRSDGSFVPVEVTRFAIRDSDSRPLALVGLVADLSERRRFEQQLVQSGKLATLGQLAAGVAHEINNPLFAILGLVEFLLREVEPGSKAEERLRLIQDTGLEIKAIVRALLDFARERTDAWSVVSLVEVARQTVELARRTTAGKSVQIVERYPDEPLLVHASSSQLKQIFLNLLANARQAMPDGGVATVEVAREGRWAVARVVDSGHGIDPGVLPRVFEPFFTTRRASGGLGLGLTVSLGIAQAHGGDLAAGSDGDGATLTLRLPAYEEGAQ